MRFNNIKELLETPYGSRKFKLLALCALNEAGAIVNNESFWHPLSLTYSLLDDLALIKKDKYGSLLFNRQERYYVFILSMDYTMTSSSIKVNAINATNLRIDTRNLYANYIPAINEWVRR